MRRRFDGVIGSVSYNFRPLDREQLYLLPVSLRDWLPEGHLAWFILDAVAQMDLRPFMIKYRADGWGGESFDPTMMVSLMLYAYCNGVRSSRVIERLCHEDIAYRVIAANQHPDHTTVCRFRQTHADALAGLFTDVLKLCYEAGLLKVGAVALDGTKMKANAALAANRTYASIEKEVKKMLAEADATDQAEDERYGVAQRGDELPEGLRDPRSRLKRLQEAKARLEREAQEAAAKQQAKIDQRQAREKATGKKSRGRPPKEPVETVADEEKANVTDPDSRIMKGRQGYVQGYNAQAVVTQDQVILAAELTQEANDVQQLHPMLKQAQASLEQIGAEATIEKATADAGYWSEENATHSSPEGPELYVATTKDWKQRKAMREEPPPRGRIPKDLSPKERMERKLRTKEGRETYATRARTVEPVFGQMKSVLGFTGFMRRGVEACANEWKLMAAAHNLLKIFRRTQPHTSGQVVHAGQAGGV